MGWDGNGVFTRTNGTNTGSNLWENDRDAGIKITAENHDNQDQDLADGIQACLAKNGENTPTANLPMGNQRHTGVGAAAAATDYARADQVQNGAFMWGGTAAGTADAITFNLTPTLTAYTTGLTVRFVASGTSTVTDPTININAAGAKTVKDQDGNALSVGDIASGTVYEAVYDGTDFRIYVAASQDLSNYVQGPASATDSAVALFDGTGGKTLKDGVTIATGSGSLLRTDGDGSGLSGVTDQTARDMAATGMAIADSGNQPGTKGAFYLADSFITDSLPVSTNATYDAAGDYYSSGGVNFVSAGTGTVIGDMTLAGGNAAAFDGTTSQAFTACARKNSSPSYVGKNWGGGNDKVIGRYKVYGSSDAGMTNQSTFTISLQGSSTGAWGGEEVTLHSAAGITDSNGITVDYDEGDGITTSTAYQYHRVLLNSGGENYVAEVEFYEKVTADMTLRPTAATIDTADPSDVMAYVRVDPVDSITYGTDLIGKISIDGGSTWATGSWTKLPSGIEGTEELYRLDADVSAQTGSSLIWELTSANSKEIRIHGIVGLVPIY